MFKEKTTLLLDMNSTFMFGEDRFEKGSDYSKYYQKIGGQLSSDIVNTSIENVFDYLWERYPNKEFQEKFPSIKDAIEATCIRPLPDEEVEKIISTFAFYEHGHIPEEYVTVLKKLQQKYTLAAVIDIWAPNDMWLATFKQLGIDELFSAISFSSDHGMVKPSPKPFEMVMSELNVTPKECLMIGDSVRRDLGGAIAAGVDCILVNGATDDKALASFGNLIEVATVA